MVVLITSDNEQFAVDKEVAERSIFIKNTLEFRGALLLASHASSYLTTCRRWRNRPACSLTSSLFFCVEKGSSMLSACCCELISFPLQVLEYCEHHRGELLQEENRMRTTDVGEWDQMFITVDQEMLFEIILAANYVDIKPLL